MAALPDRYADSLTERLQDLREVTAEQLSPLLEEETQAWGAELDWDFHPSADLVRRRHANLGDVADLRRHQAGQRNPTQRALRLIPGQE